MKVAVISNHNSEIFSKFIRNDFSLMNSVGYGSLYSDFINPSSELHSFKPDYCLLLVDGKDLCTTLLDGVYNETTIDNFFKSIVRFQEQSPQTKILISNIDFFCKIDFQFNKPLVEIETAWERFLATYCDQEKLFRFDLKSIIALEGQHLFYDNLAWSFGGIKYTDKANRLIVKKFEEFVDIHRHGRKKCLVLDLDNTLWGGVVGETGSNGVTLARTGIGSNFYDFQVAVKNIKKSGIVLCICSKNNYDDAAEVFEKNDNCFLSLDDFVLTKINWENKYSNIQKIAEELNIGLDSIVFVDDSPIERDQVKTFLPTVAVPEFPNDDLMLSVFADEIYHKYFFPFEVTEEDAKKTQMYKEGFKRIESKNSFTDYEAYCLDLKSKIDIMLVDDSNVDRAFQLLQKTNQFNLTTKRHSIDLMKKMIVDERYQVYICKMSDRFGDNGLSCVVIVDNLSDVPVLDSFAMSCRVMGRFLEDSILDAVEEICLKSGKKRLGASFVPTKKNKPVEMFFERNGYAVTDNFESGEKKYLVDLSKRNKVKSCFYAEINISDEIKEYIK